MQTLNQESRFNLNTEQISTKLEQDTVILNLATGQYYSLEGVASLIWQGFEAKYSLGEIQEKIVATYDVSPEQSLSDIQSFIVDLTHAGLISLQQT
jgi:hypothetical protein